VARTRLARAVRGLVEREQRFLDTVRSRPVLARPTSMLDQRADQVTGLRDRAARTLAHRLDRAGTELHHTLARLRGLSPAATLERGYAIVQRFDDGTVLRGPDQASVGDALRVRLAGGELAATVTDVSQP